jgi:hypothetical protein
VQRLFGSQRALKTVEDFTEFYGNGTGGIQGGPGTGFSPRRATRLR